MEIVNLPTQLNLDDSSPIKLFDYQTSVENIRQMVTLQANTFSFLREGRKEVYFDRESVSIQKSHFLLMKTGHCLMTEKLPDPTENYRSLLLFFTNKALLDFIRKYKVENPKNFPQKSVFSFPYDTFINTFVQGLTDIIKLNNNLKNKLLELKFEELMIYLMETKGVDFIFSLLTPVDNQTQHFIDLVETNKLNKLTVKELAFLSNRSVSGFKREFEKHFHCSPIKWFKKKRLEHAAFLLKDKSRRPSDIFEEIGYESLSNFIQAYKAEFGITPKQDQTN